MRPGDGTITAFIFLDPPEIVRELTTSLVLTGGWNPNHVAISTIVVDSMSGVITDSAFFTRSLLTAFFAGCNSALFVLHFSLDQFVDTR